MELVIYGVFGSKGDEKGAGWVAKMAHFFDFSKIDHPWLQSQK